MKIIKKLAAFITCIIIFLCPSVYVQADETSGSADYRDTALQIISNYVNSINSRDWSAYRQCFDASFQEELKNFPSPKQAEQKTGLLAVDNISITMIKEINPSDALYAAPRFKELDPSEYDLLYFYYAGFDLKVSHESQYYYNGPQFSLIAVGINSGAAKIAQIETAYHFDRIMETGIAFNTEEELTARTIVAARNLGIIINAKCEVLSYLSNGAETNALENGLVSDGLFQTSMLISLTDEEGPHPIYYWDDEPYINVYITSQDTIKTMPLFDYIINVLPNEWYASWHTESLKAGAMAIKSYAWYNIMNPRKPAKEHENAHITDLSENYQHYVENSANVLSTFAVREVQNYVMVDASYIPFEADYKAGAYNDYGQGGNRMYQWGTKYLADNGMSFMDICAYYYTDIRWVITNNE